MKIYSALQIGQSHINNCEDYLLFEPIGNNKMLCAVMDGCTMGKDSYFASTLTGRLLRKISKELFYREFLTKDPPQSDQAILEWVLKSLFRELLQAKNLLQLENHELLNTLILLIFDQNQGNGICIVIGDGIVCVDGDVKEFDQNNVPDYIGYHINEDFNEWFLRQHQKVCFDHFNDLSISTDGILTFEKSIKESVKVIDPINYLLVNKEDSDNAKMLSSKISILEREFALLPLDDLGIIRIIR